VSDSAGHDFRLATKLLKVCNNPVFAGFNHFLFESVAALLVAAQAAHSQSTLTSLENRLLAAFNLVLEGDVQEFHPYVFQIIALTVSSSKELRPEYEVRAFPPAFPASTCVHMLGFS
jgi:exportin-2 (importin alpha re-exporter)